MCVSIGCIFLRCVNGRQPGKEEGQGRWGLWAKPWGKPTGPKAGGSSRLSNLLKVFQRRGDRIGNWTIYTQAPVLMSYAMSPWEQEGKWRDRGTLELTRESARDAPGFLWISLLQQSCRPWLDWDWLVHSFCKHLMVYCVAADTPHQGNKPIKLTGRWDSSCCEMKSSWRRWYSKWVLNRIGCVNCHVKVKFGWII